MADALNRLSPEARYQRDPRFKAWVDLLESQIHAAEMTPTEVREAAVLAAIHFELRQAVPRKIVVAEGVGLDALPTPHAPPPAVMVDGFMYRLDVGPRGGPYRG